MVRRLRVLLTSGNLQAVRAAAAASGGHLPLNLLAPIAPHLTSQLKALLVATSAGGAPLPRGALSEYVFDGLHLTLLGFAGCVVAWGRGAEMVVVPEGCAVVQAPTHRVSASGDGGSADVRVMDGVGGYGVEPWCARVPLGDVCARWGHLDRILRISEGTEVAEAVALLQAEEQGRDVETPEGILALYGEFLSAMDVPASFHVWRAHGMFAPLIAGYSASFCKLTGMDAELVHAAAAADPDLDIRYRYLMIHPSSAQHRAVAGMAAVGAGLDAYQLEGQMLRRRPAPAPVVDAGAAASSDARLQADYLLPFCCVSTRHTERYPSGRTRTSVTYNSDIVLCHQGAEEAAGNSAFAAAELHAMRELFVPREKTGYTPAVRSALRGPVAAGDPARLLQCLDVETAERLMLRLMMVAHSDSDALLARHAAAEVLDVSAALVPGLQGVTPAGVAALREDMQRSGMQSLLDAVSSGILAMGAMPSQEVAVRLGEEHVRVRMPGKGYDKLLARYGVGIKDA